MENVCALKCASEKDIDELLEKLPKDGRRRGRIGSDASDSSGKGRGALDASGRGREESDASGRKRGASDAPDRGSGASNTKRRGSGASDRGESDPSRRRKRRDRRGPDVSVLADISEGSDTSPDRRRRKKAGAEGKGKDGDDNDLGMGGTLSDENKDEDEEEKGDDQWKSRDHMKMHHAPLPEAKYASTVLCFDPSKPRSFWKPKTKIRGTVEPSPLGNDVVLLVNVRPSADDLFKKSKRQEKRAEAGSHWKRFVKELDKFCENVKTKYRHWAFKTENKCQKCWEKFERPLLPCTKKLCPNAYFSSAEPSGAEEGEEKGKDKGKETEKGEETETAEEELYDSGLEAQYKKGYDAGYESGLADCKKKREAGKETRPGDGTGDAAGTWHGVQSHKRRKFGPRGRGYGTGGPGRLGNGIGGPGGRAYGGGGPKGRGYGRGGPRDYGEEQYCPGPVRSGNKRKRRSRRLLPCACGTRGRSTAPCGPTPARSLARPPSLQSSANWTLDARPQRSQNRTPLSTTVIASPSTYQSCPGTTGVGTVSEARSPRVSTDPNICRQGRNAGPPGGTHDASTARSRRTSYLRNVFTPGKCRPQWDAGSTVPGLTTPPNYTGPCF